MVCLVSAAWAQQEPERRRPTIAVGLDVGVFFPIEQEVKDIFDDVWFRVGLSPLSFQDPGKWTFTFDVAYMRETNNGHSVTLIPVTFGVARSFGEADGTSPYVAFRAGPYYGDLKAPIIGVDTDEIGFNANASAGINFNKSFYVEGRFDFFSDLGGLNFSGFFINVGFKIFEIRL